MSETEARGRQSHANGYGRRAEATPAPRVEDWPEEAVQRLWEAIWADATPWRDGTDSDEDEERRSW